MSESKPCDVSPITLSPSYYPFSLSQVSELIKKTVEKERIPITPMQVTLKTGIKAATVRKYLRRLEKKRFIQRIAYGLYAGLEYSVTLRSSMVGECDSLPRAHSLRLLLPGFLRSGSSVVREDLGLVSVTIQRYKNGKAQVFFDCHDKYSMDIVALLAVLKYAWNELGVKGYDGIRVLSVELNNDFIGTRLDGVQAVTFTDFMGNFRRLYNTRFGYRDEIKIVGQRKLEEIIPLLHGGVSLSTSHQILFMSYQEIQKLTTAMCGIQGNIERMVDAQLHKSLSRAKKRAQLTDQPKPRQRGGP